jgi:hypothetical protein
MVSTKTSVFLFRWKEVFSPSLVLYTAGAVTYLIHKSFILILKMSETYGIVDEFGVGYDKTQKGKDRLSFEECLYLYDSKWKTQRYWKCVNPVCGGRLILSGRVPRVSKVWSISGNKPCSILSTFGCT